MGERAAAVDAPVETSYALRLPVLSLYPSYGAEHSGAAVMQVRAARHRTSCGGVGAWLEN